MTPYELRTWREARGYSRHRLGRLLGIDFKRLYHWEHGTYRVPQYLPLALEALDRRAQDLAERLGEPLEESEEVLIA